MLAYIEKKHYHVGEEFPDIDFVWHPDTLFQPSDISDIFLYVYEAVNLKV